MAIDLSKFIIRFIEEARDHLRRLSEGLSLIEQGQTTDDSIHALFRSAHTIKGSSRMLKLMPISELAHQIEEVLGALREQRLVFHPLLLTRLYAGVDALSTMVDQLEAHKDPSQCVPVDTQLMANLSTLLTPEASQPTAQPSNTIDNQSAPSVTLASTPDQLRQERDLISLKAADSVRIRLSKLDELLALMGEVVSSHSRLRQRLQEAHQLAHAGQGASIDQNHVGFYHALKDDVQYQELQMNELLDKALLMRMLPLSMVFDSVSRLVRELGQSIGKSLTCQVQGAEIELDRQLIDRLSDPIVHLIRNAIDHGIESPEQRLANGKPVQGTIRLSARQDAGWVVIEVADDGAGIPLSAVLDKAVRKGLTTAEQALQLSEAEVIDFIFMPGFSTSTLITDLSGRGVGMDVVKTIIVDELHGRISVETTPQKGTCFQLRLPLSLAVMRVLVIGVAGHYWAFTAQYVVELLRVENSQLLAVAERQVVVVRNEFVPVVHLAQLLGLSSAPPASDSALLLLVVQVRHEKLALVVDQLMDERDMVLKPLPRHLQFNQLVSGMVVTGDNLLVNVLHAPALFALAQASRHQAQHSERPLDIAPVISKHLLVVDDSLNTREIEKDVLEAHGFQVTLAEDGVYALRKARDIQFDAILTDVEMPNMDGFTLTAQLRQLPQYVNTPIMIITSREKEEDKRRGMQVGADAYIVKGDFDQSNLVTTLKALLA